MREAYLSEVPCSVVERPEVMAIWQMARMQAFFSSGSVSGMSDTAMRACAASLAT